MRKLMFLVLAAVTTIVTQAASFAWQVSTGATYGGMNVYCISGTTADAVITAFGATDDASKWTSNVSGITPVTSTTGARGYAGSNIAGVAEGDNLVFAIIDGDIAEGNNWYVLADYTIPAGSTFEPPTTGTKVKIDVGTPTSGTFKLSSPTPVIPEPTSGLLLLVGGAMLALRRKQK